MPENLLVIKAGSSSVKFALFGLGGDRPLQTLKGQISGIGASSRIDVQDHQGNALPFSQKPEAISSHEEAFDALIDWLLERGEKLAGAGHRVVHGGVDYTTSVSVDDDVLEALETLTPLAPHHQPHNLAAIRTLAARLPDLPQVACFDTAFHTTQPAVARQLGLPRSYEQKGLRRYGFHGLSYQSVVDSFPDATGQALPSRLVIAHLGNGASMCAIRDGKSVATTMGFSTLDGLPMGTRIGSIDAGVLLHLMNEEGLDLAQLEDVLYNRSGLLGVSGISPDMRELLKSDAREAGEAVAFFCYRISRELGSLAATLGGLDGLIFTGGIGENAPQVRARVLEQSDWLGLHLDAKANHASDVCMTRADSPATAWVLPTAEEAAIAGHTCEVLGL